jgi:hypothetical protein
VDVFQGVYFTELNHDGSLDAVLLYWECYNHGAGEPYAALLLNGGENRFVLSGIVALGPGDLIESKPPYQFQTQEITINGNRFTAIVYKPPFVIRPWEKTLKPKPAPPKHYELYIYHSILKEFVHIAALPGDAKSSFVPLDQKKFEVIFNHPLLRKVAGSDVTKADESAISTLIDNYEKSLVNAINNNNFSLVAKYLTHGSNLYQSQKALVAKLHQKKTQEKLVGFKVEKIKTTDQANVYQVYVSEKIGLKRHDKGDFVVSEFRWVYSVVADGPTYSLSDITKWDWKYVV